jgi:hypothetical protein
MSSIDKAVSKYNLSAHNVKSIMRYVLQNKDVMSLLAGEAGNMEESASNLASIVCTRSASRRRTSANEDGVSYF